MIHLRDLRKEAKENGVRMVNFNDYLDYIGQPKANPIPDPDKPRPKDFRKANPAEARIQMALAEQTEISFVETTLKDAMDYIEDLHNIDIIIKEAEIVEDGGSIGQPVNIEFSGGKLESALDLMLEPLGLDYVVKNEVMIITTRQAAAHFPKYQELRIYDLGQFNSLLDGTPLDVQTHQEQVMKIIKNAVAGDWAQDDRQGKGGTMSLTSAGLVVRQNQRTHREIENLMDQLRRAAEAK